MAITLALADDHKALRKAFAQTLEQSGVFHVIIQADNGRQLLDELNRASSPPDICILDLNMPELDGIETLQMIRKQFPMQKTLIYSMFLDDFNFRRVYKHGANGAIAKDCDLTDVVRAIEMIVREGIYLPATLAPEVNIAIKRHRIELPKITDRETQYLRYYCEGLSQKEISSQMNVAVKTADAYREHLTQKLGIKSRNGLLLFAIKTGIAGWKF